MPINGFDPVHLTRDLGDQPGTLPRVLVLHNVARLSPAQQEGIEQFLGDRGAVLVTCGDRCEAKYYNENLFRGGEADADAAPDPIGARTTTPRRPGPCPQASSTPRWNSSATWPSAGSATPAFPRAGKSRAHRGECSTAIAMMTGSEPLLIERPYRTGRVIAATVPLDNSWRSNLTDLPAFVPLAHELIYHLASARSAEVNLVPGQPIRYKPDDENQSSELSLQPPDGDPKILAVKSWPLIYDDTREPGVYVLTDVENRAHYCRPARRVSRNWPRPARKTGRKSPTSVPNLVYATDAEQVADALTKGSMTKELWPVLLGVFAAVQ